MAKYAYVRVSTDKQSYAQQCQEFKAYGIDITKLDDIISEHESGGTSYQDRKFMQLFKRCQAGDIIYVASTDRLGRDFYDMLDLMKKAKERGVEIIACQQNLSLCRDDLSTQIILAISFAIAQDERMRTKRRNKNKADWQREQIKKHGYFIIEKGPNAGKPRSHMGSEKGHDVSAAAAASAASRHAASVDWMANSKAVKRARQKRAEGYSLEQIAQHISDLYDDFDGDGANPYGTPKGCKPSKGTIHRWLSRSNDIII